MKFKLAIISIALSLICLAVFYNYTYEKEQQTQILNKIEQLQELATAKQIYREVIYSKENQDIFWMPIKNKEFLISLDYLVTAGVDISKGYTVQKKDGRMVITLPRGEILSIDAKDSSLIEHKIEERFMEISRDDYFIIINQSKEDILHREEINELLLLCEENCSLILKNLLLVASVEVDVNFSDSVIKVKQ